MKQDVTNSADDLDTTSPDASDPLSHETAVARDAIMRQLDEIKARLGESTSLPGVVQRHPWLTMAVATGVGFVAAKIVLSPRPASPSPRESTSPPTETPRQASVRGSWWSTLAGPVIEIAKIVIERLLLHALSSAKTNAKAGTDSAAMRDEPNAARDAAKADSSPA